jgi:hypothetical protein
MTYLLAKYLKFAYAIYISTLQSLYKLSTTSQIIPALGEVRIGG